MKKWWGVNKFFFGHITKNVLHICCHSLVVFSKNFVLSKIFSTQNKTKYLYVHLPPIACPNMVNKALIPCLVTPEEPLLDLFLLGLFWFL